MNRLEQLEEILGGHEEASNLLEAIDILEDRLVANQQDREEALDLYLQIRKITGELQATAQEVIELYK